MTDLNISTASAERARRAMLSLQIRTARAEAEALERDLAAAMESARADLRERLADVHEQHRRLLEDQLVRAQAEADAAVEHARQDAARVIEPPTFAEPETFAPVEHITAYVPSVQSLDFPEHHLPAGVTRTTPVVIDIETLARVCAVVVAEVMNERYGPAPLALGATPSFVQAPSPAPVAARKTSALRNLLHLDIMLIVGAVSIVAVMLVAWLG